MEIHALACPFCAAPISQKERVCDYCGREYMISSFSSLSKIDRSGLNKYTNAYSDALKSDPKDPALNRSIGICYIKLGVYDKALNSFENLIETDPEGSFGYYGAAISLLEGRSAFLSDKKRIDKAIKYMDAALIIEEIGVYHYLMAYLKYEYYKRKYLKIEPDYNYHLEAAVSLHISDEDKKSLFEMLKVAPPKDF